MLCPVSSPQMLSVPSLRFVCVQEHVEAEVHLCWHSIYHWPWAPHVGQSASQWICQSASLVLGLQGPHLPLYTWVLGTVPWA